MTTTPERAAPSPPTPEPESTEAVVRCRFCAEPATAICGRCGRPFCEDHGGVTCARCADPLSGVPSGGFVRSAALTLAAAALVAVVLLIVRPRLPSEAAPAVVPPPAATAAGGSAPTVPRPAATAGAPAASPTSAAGARSYTVQANDTLGNIAAQFGTTVEAIVAANPGVSANSLQIGRVLVIPPVR